MVGKEWLRQYAGCVVMKNLPGLNLAFKTNIGSLSTPYCNWLSRIMNITAEETLNLYAILEPKFRKSLTVKKEKTDTDTYIPHIL